MIFHLAARGNLCPKLNPFLYNKKACYFCQDIQLTQNGRPMLFAIDSYCHLSRVSRNKLIGNKCIPGGSNGL